MKIGILSDIHAQYDALEKTLQLLERENVDMIVCAGDLVDKGDDGDRVIEEFIRRKIPCVRGNHDEAAISNQRWWRKELGDKTVGKILDRLNRGESIKSPLLADRTVVYLQTLPFRLEFEWEGVHVLLIHGSPRSNEQYLMPASPDRLLREALNGETADIIICGHTHSPMYRPLGEQLLLNPGSVCYSPYRRESHTCAILTLPSRDFKVFSVDTGIELYLK